MVAHQLFALIPCMHAQASATSKAGAGNDGAMRTRLSLQSNPLQGMDAEAVVAAQVTQQSQYTN